MKLRNGLEFTINISRDSVTCQDNQVIIVVGLTPTYTGFPRQWQEGNFSLALTIDCSGSMNYPETEGSSVTKLDRAIQSLEQIAQQIRDKDRFSLIAFDHRCQTIISAASGEQRQEILNSFDRLRNFGGDTNIYAALEQAFTNLNTPDMMANPVRRVILLTDGEITWGRDEEDCCKLAAKMAEAGIIIDALGYGTNYHIDFITQLVESSGGSQTYALTMDQVHNTLQSIFSAMRKVSATDVKLTFDFPLEVETGDLYQGVYQVNSDALESMRCYSRVPVSASRRQVSIMVGQVEIDRGKIIALDVRPRISSGQTGTVTLAQVQLSYSSPSGQSHQESRTICVEVTDDPIKARGSYDLRLLGLIDELRHSKCVFDLGQAQRRGDYVRLLRTLEQLIEDSKKHGWKKRQEEYEQLLDEYRRTGRLNEVIVKAARSVSSSTSSGIKRVLIGQPADEGKMRPLPIKRKSPFQKS